MSTPLVAPPHRRAVLGVAAGGAGLVAALGFRYRGGSGPGWLDSWFDGPLSMRGSALRGLPEAVVSLGSPVPAALLAAALIAAALVRRRRRAAVLVVLGPPVAVALTQLVLKPLVGRVDEDGLVFPSGHATLSSALLLCAAVQLTAPRAGPPPGPGPGVLRGAALVALGLLLLAVPAAIAATGYHYVTDGIAAVALSAAVVLPLAVLLDRAVELPTRPRPRSRRPAVSADPTSWRTS